MPALPNFSYEEELWNKGVKIVGGCDEVGRGCFAGPVVAGCVVFDPIFNYQFSKKIIINDSKLLSQSHREMADEWIKENALAWGIGQASVAEINNLGIVKATNKAFRLAIRNAESRLQLTVNRKKQIKISTGYGKLTTVNFLLTDAFYIPNVRGLPIKKQLPIIKGDQKSISIASASIIAKVYRDNYMQSISCKSKYKKYNWNTNKGYGTRQHREAILKYGITKQHREKFVKTFLSKSYILRPTTHN